MVLYTCNGILFTLQKEGKPTSVGWICAKCHCGFVLRDTVTERQILPGFMYIQGFPGGSESKASAYNEGDLGSIPG